jgi:hypothetical protein
MRKVLIASVLGNHNPDVRPERSMARVGLLHPPIMAGALIEQALEVIEIGCERPATVMISAPSPAQASGCQRSDLRGRRAAIHCMKRRRYALLGAIRGPK